MSAARVESVQSTPATEGVEALAAALRQASLRAAEMSDFIARGRAENMQTFDQHLLDLLVANKISVETALAAASNPTDFQTKLSLEGHSPDEESSGDKPLEPFELDSDGRF